MSNSNILAPLDECHALIQELLTLAETGDWEAFERKVPEREPLLQAIGEDGFLKSVAEAGLAEDMRDRIADMQRLNDRITELAETAKAGIAADLKRHNQQKHAIEAYSKR